MNRMPSFFVVRKCMFAPHYYRNWIICKFPCKPAYSRGTYPYLLGELIHAFSLSAKVFPPLVYTLGPWFNSVNYLKCLINNFIFGRSFLYALKCNNVLLLLSDSTDRFNWLCFYRYSFNYYRDFMLVIWVMGLSIFNVYLYLYLSLVNLFIIYNIIV